MKHFFSAILFVVILVHFGCNTTQEITKNTTPAALPEPLLKSGWWLMKMDLGSDKLPIRFSYHATTNKLIVYNAEEEIVCEGVTIRNDSLFFRAPVFENEFKFRILNTGELSGYWYNLSKTDYKIACTAKYHSEQNTSIISGQSKQKKVEVHFSSNSTDAYDAIGLFNLYASIELHNSIYTPVTGTFLTETGDYRFLEGKLVNDELTLSCFDGSHVFLFKAKYNTSKDTLKGNFYSGNHFKEPWIGWENNNATLRNPDSLTRLKPGYTGLEFSFPLSTNLNSFVTYPSAQFNNKVTIVQILGSWCPNCMDETLFLESLRKKYQSKGFEVVGLCFERCCDDFERSTDAVNKMKKSLGANYDFLIAGPASKQKASEKLPMLTEIMSFPTTIFIDKNGKVRKIFTGYYGPSTGAYHQMYKEQTIDFIEMLLAE